MEESDLTDGPSYSPQQRRALGKAKFARSEWLIQEVLVAIELVRAVRDYAPCWNLYSMSMLPSDQEERIQAAVDRLIAGNTDTLPVEFDPLKPTWRGLVACEIYSASPRAFLVQVIDPPDPWSRYTVGEAMQIPLPAHVRTTVPALCINIEAMGIVERRPQDRKGWFR